MAHNSVRVCVRGGGPRFEQLPQQGGNQATEWRCDGFVVRVAARQHHPDRGVQRDRQPRLSLHHHPHSSCSRPRPDPFPCSLKYLSLFTHPLAIMFIPHIICFLHFFYLCLYFMCSV